jgi:hypothetical protein
MRKLTEVSIGRALFLALATSGAHALTVPQFTPSSGQPGVSAPGEPDSWSLDYSASLTTGKTTDTLTILGSNANLFAQNGVLGLFNFKNASYYVSHETLKITANFSTTGVFQSGTVEIDGSLNPWHSPTLGSSPAGYPMAVFRLRLPSALQAFLSRSFQRVR